MLSTPSGKSLSFVRFLLETSIRTPLSTLCQLHDDLALEVNEARQLARRQWTSLCVATHSSVGNSSQRVLWSQLVGEYSSNVRSVHTTANHSSSHVFCDQCTDALGLNAAAGNNRICPACQTALDKPDDAAITLLQPTEDYKTSVLSGLNPSTIMECAARGLAFWSYQSTQEMYVGRYQSGPHALTNTSIYQEYLAKTLTDKYSTLNVQMDKVINDANSELNILNQKLNSMSVITLC